MAKKYSDDPFPRLNYLKKLYLIYEAEFGTLKTNEWFEEKCDAGLEKITSIEDFCRFVTQFEKECCQNYYNYYDNDRLYDLFTGDYIVYTHDQHGRKFWNEIENPPFLEKLLKKLIWLLPDAAWSMPYDYSLVLYDFNDLDIYFKTIEDVYSFIEEFDIAPATLFTMDNTGHYVEMWSI